MRSNKNPPFGISPSVLVVFGASLLVYAAILLHQLHLRNDVDDRALSGIFYHLYINQDYPAAALGLIILFVALLAPMQRAGAACADFVAARPVVTASLAAFMFSIGAVVVYHAYPLCMDEYSPYFQSQAFAAGKLTGTFPASLVDWLVVPGFQKSFLYVSHESGRVASAYLPGFALVLTPFSFLGVPWLANPLIGGLSVLAIYALALELTQSRGAAGAAAFLSLASPAFSINSMSFYSMPAHLLCNAAFVLLLLRPEPWRVAMAGLVGGLALTLHNPVPHLLFAAPWLLWLLARPDRRLLVPAVVLGYLPWVLFVGVGWQYVLGSIASTDNGAHVAAHVGPIATALSALGKLLSMPDQALLAARVAGVAKIFVWAVPSILIFAAVGAWTRRADTRVRLLLASALLTLFGYLFVPFDQGHGWGFRYFHSAWFVVPVLAAAALAPRDGSDGESAAQRAAMAAYLHACTLGSLVLLTGYFAWQVSGFISAHLRQLPSSPSGQARVIFVDPKFGYYAYDLVQNDPFMRGPTVRMLTHGPTEDAKLMARSFPEAVQLAGDFRGSVWGAPAGGAGAKRTPGRSPPALPEEKN